MYGKSKRISTCFQAPPIIRIKHPTCVDDIDLSVANVRSRTLKSTEDLIHNFGTASQRSGACQTD